jgi:hypothetical protein
MYITPLECGVSTTNDLLSSVNTLVDLNNKVYEFTTLSYIKDNESSIPVGTIVKTNGYYIIGDGGGAVYTVISLLDKPSNINIDEWGNHTLSDGNILLLSNKEIGELCVHQYGAKGDVVNGVGTNDVWAIRAALAQAKANALLQTVTTWDTMSGGVVTLGARNYGVLITQQDIDSGIDCALPVTRRTGLKGAGRNVTYISCLNGFRGVVVANERHIAKGFDDFLEIGGFQILGRFYHGIDCKPTIGLRINCSSGTGIRTDNFSRFYDIYVLNTSTIGVYGSGRGEMAWDNIQSSNCPVGWELDSLVDSYFTRCNSGGNWYAGFKLYKMASSKFDNCKSYYNGSSGTTQRDSCNWLVDGDSWVSGQIVFSNCEAQESHGSGWVILCGGNMFVNCTSADPRRSSIGNSNIRPDNSVCWYLGKSNYWVQSKAMNNHFQNCIATPNLTINYSDLDQKSYMGDGALYIESTCAQNTGNIVIAPRVKVNNYLVGGKGSSENPLLNIMGEALKDATLPSPSIIFYKNELKGLRIYGNQIAERNHKVTDYKVELNLGAGVLTNWIDPKVAPYITGMVEGQTYEIVTSPVSLIGQGSANTQSITREITRYVCNLPTNPHGWFACNKPLINLESPVIEFSFTVGDRLNISSDLQSMFYQGNDSTPEIFVSLLGEYNFRIGIGGSVIDGLGVGKPMRNRKFNIKVYTVGLEVYSDGILEGASNNYVRGNVRANNSKMYVGKVHPTHTSTKTLAGTILDISSGGTTIIFDNPETGGVQSTVEGDLTLNATSTNIVTDNWSIVPIVV